jgi:hypothetical protein
LMSCLQLNDPKRKAPFGKALCPVVHAADSF